MQWYARTALVLVIAASGPLSANAQLFGRSRTAPPAQSSTDAKSAAKPGKPAAKEDPNLVTAAESLPELTPYNELPPSDVKLPEEPVDPFLVTVNEGPFMVIAKTFRGDNAVKYAQLLCMELRRDHHLAAFVYYPKVQPRHSNIRGIPPTAPPQTQTGMLKGKERYRLYDEAAVLVGNAKTEQDQAKLLRTVKKIHPKCLEKMPTIFSWRAGSGLKGALATTNPLVPAQKLYPNSADPMILRMNSGEHSIYRCPGPYTLQVGYFVGRSTFDVHDPQFLKAGNLETSPLKKAHLDAEDLAAELAKSDELMRAGYQVYTYHDRYSSQVTVGSFQQENDPSAERLRALIVRIATKKLSDGKFDIPFGPQPNLMVVPKK